MKAVKCISNSSPFTFKLLSLFLLIFSLPALWAQPPEKMNYQAIIRDANNNLVSNNTIGMQISILQGSETGTAVYVETHTPVTDENGLVYVEVGGGSVVSGVFSAIDWSDGPYFFKTETDPEGGSNYTISGTTQFLSVPFALNAKTADNFTETDTVFDGSVAWGISEEDTTGWNSKLDTEVDGSMTNEIQTISRTGPTVTLTDGSTFTDSVNVFTGDMQNQRITNLTDPVNDKDAASKAYIDALEARADEIENIIIYKGLYIIRDMEDNIYTTVLIGNQHWMDENLRTATYNDGTPITKITEKAGWLDLDDPAYCWHEYDSATHDSIYGKLYNWYAVNTGILCPTGWHVPSEAEMTELITYIGGVDNAGGKLKTSGISLWDSPNTGGTNLSGFDALPGSNNNNYGTMYDDIGSNATFWSADENEANTYQAWYIKLFYDSSGAEYTDLEKRYGFSVRCLKDD